MSARSDAMDLQQIANLLYRYAELIDAGDLDGLAQMFEFAVMASDVDEISGVDAVLERFTSTARLHDNGTPMTSHIVTNPIIELDGDTAEVRSRYTVMQATDEHPLQPIICGRYDDQVEYVDGQWRFARRHYRVDLLGDVSHHLPESLVRFLAGQ